MQDIIDSQIAAAQSPEEVFTLLSNRRRRDAVDVLSNQETAVTLRKLVDSIAARETGTDDVPEEAADAVATALHHVHLPKLDQAGVVSYHPTAGTVEYHESPALESLLAASETADDTDEQQ